MMISWFRWARFMAVVCLACVDEVLDYENVSRAVVAWTRVAGTNWCRYWWKIAYLRGCLLDIVSGVS
jgi:hypothetical protein